MWGRERLLKDWSWALALIMNRCGQPTKSKRATRAEDLVKSGNNKEYKKNPYYLQIMGIRGK